MPRSRARPSWARSGRHRPRSWKSAPGRVAADTMARSRFSGSAAKFEREGGRRAPPVLSQESRPRQYPCPCSCNLLKQTKALLSYASTQKPSPHWACLPGIIVEQGTEGGICSPSPDVVVNRSNEGAWCSIPIRLVRPFPLLQRYISSYFGFLCLVKLQQAV